MSVIRAHSVGASTFDAAPFNLLTLIEAARELRCSRSFLYKIQAGRVGGLPPLPLFRIGRKAFIRRNQLEGWIRSLEDREREVNYASGCFGVRDDTWEEIGGA